MAPERKRRLPAPRKGTNRPPESRPERGAIAESAAEQPPAPPRAKRLIQMLILVMLAAPTLISTADRIRTGYGFDFYNFWGVTVARRSEGPALGDPYRNGADYLAKVKQVGTANDTAKLGVAAGYWNRPDYTATPLLYMVFGLVPRDFDVALVVYQTVQVAAFVVAWLVLGYLCGIDLFSASYLALASLIAYQPFVSDLRVANLGSVQFVVLVGVLAGARGCATTTAERRRPAPRHGLRRPVRGARGVHTVQTKRGAGRGTAGGPPRDPPRTQAHVSRGGRRARRRRGGGDALRPCISARGTCGRTGTRSSMDRTRRCSFAASPTGITRRSPCSRRVVGASVSGRQ